MLERLATGRIELAVDRRTDQALQLGAVQARSPSSRARPRPAAAGAARAGSPDITVPIGAAVTSAISR